MSVNSDSAADFRNKILKLLHEHLEGLTIEDLSRAMCAHRQTVTKYLSWLEGADRVYRRRIGAVTLCYLKKDWERLKK